MIVHIKAFAIFREILGRDFQVVIDDGSGVMELLDSLCSSHPRLKSAIFDESGGFREYVILMKNRKDIEAIGGLEATLSEGDEVAILPPIAGG